MTTPALGRVAAPLVADERAMLAAWLDYHRATLETKCAGVFEESLRERLEGHPSPLSLLGLVRHMADVERAWFRRGVAGQDAPPQYYSEDDPDGDFDNVDDADIEDAFATWRAECERAREADTPGTGGGHTGHERRTQRAREADTTGTRGRHNGHERRTRGG